MKPLRIAFITPFFPLKGGIARFSGLLRDALRDRGYEVVSVAFKALYPEFLSQGAAEGTHAHDTVVPDEVRLVLYNPFSWFGTVRLIRALNPDILLVSYWTGVLAPFYYVLHSLTGIRIVVLLHNLSSHESLFFDPFMRLLLSAFADGFVTLSKTVFQEVSAAMPEIPVLPLFHPIYEPEGEIPSMHDSRRALHLGEEPPVLLFFGYVRPYKGLDLLLRAMPEILQRDPALRLVVAGQFFDNPLKYKRLIEKLGIVGSVDLYPGYVSRERTALFFAAADAVVLPYRSATQSGVAQLAYGHGLPVIVTPAGSLPEIVRHGETGWVARDCSSGGVAAAVGEFLENRKNLMSVRSAIETFRHDFSWEAFAAATGDFLEAEISRR
ncbi:MAG: glycosyltransferase family 4 protein [Chlorobiaceae bacterium]|nr:glycosyltransferase family 4 protein [Chlorobiaceae bacterium]